MSFLARSSCRRALSSRQLLWKHAEHRPLTPEQLQFITQELDDYRKYYQNIEDERLDVAEHGKQRILDRLNEDQKRKFNDLFSKPIRAAQ